MYNRRNEMNKFEKLLNDNNGEVVHYAWPGGYEFVYYCRDNGTLCPNCVEENLDLILQSIKEDYDDQWIVNGYQAVETDNAEDFGKIICDNCYKVYTYWDDERSEQR
jgi:hypothetical protein